MENVDTGETYDSIALAADEAESGHTLDVELGAEFEEDVTIDTHDLTLQAAGNSRVTVDGDGGVLALEESGNSSREIDEEVDVLILESKGNSQPEITGEVGVLILESKGNSQPEIDTDLDQLILTSRGNAQPVVNGDVDRLILDTQGNSTPQINGDVGESTDGPGVNSQPEIKGNLEIEANGVSVDGFDIEVDEIGIDVHSTDPETVQLSNNAIYDADGATNNSGDPPERGIGVRITTRTESESLTIGGEYGANVFSNNDVGVLVVNTDGEIADVNTMALLRNNTFSRNHVGLVPDPGAPKDEPDPSVSAEPPVEVVTSEREAGDTITADLPDVTVDEDESMNVLSMSVRRESTGTIEFVFDPEASVEEPEFADGYRAIDDGAFEIDTALDEEEIAAVRFTFAIEREKLEDPDQFVLHRRVDGEFEPLRTELVAETPTSYQYAAFSPGFSIFQMTEFDVGGIGGAGREVGGTLVLPERDEEVPEDEWVDEVFVRVESTEDITDLELEETDSAVSIDESISIDLESYPADELPETFFDLFRITNTGEEPATIRTSAGLSQATFTSVPLDLDLGDIIDGPLLVSGVLDGLSGVLAELVDIPSNPIELEPGESVSMALSLSSTEPDNQLWVTLGIPTLTREDTGEPYPASEATESLEDAGMFYDCINHSDAPVMHHREYAYGDSDGWWFTPIGASGEDWTPDDSDEDKRYLRVPAYLSVNWHGDSRDRGTETVEVRIEKSEGPDGSMVAIYDKNGLVEDEGDVLTPPIDLSYTEAEFSSGAIQDEFDLVFESDSDCDPDGAFNYVTMDRVYENVGDLGITVSFAGTDNRWAEIAGQPEVSAAAEYYTLGETTSDVTNELLEETFQTFAEGVIGAALPGPVMTYRGARALTASGAGNLDWVAIWSGIDTLVRDQALTPQSLFAERVSTGMTGFNDSSTIELAPPLQELDLDVGLFGPSVYVSDDSEPACIEPGVRTLSVEGQVTGGPVVLMGLDSELSPGNSNHGPPEEHAALVESILDSVTNGGEGILVLGGNPDSNPDIEEYWVEDVAEDPRVDEEVTFVNGGEDIRDVDFDGYAMIGIVSSTGQIPNGLIDSENEALVERQNAIAAFINDGGGLLGKTQDGLADPWAYISPIAELESVHANNSSIEVTDAGKELGLTEDGMDGWCCYHGSFEEASVPDFLDVLLRNPEQSSNPPAAIGGEDVVLKTAVELEITGPSNVEVDRPTEFEFSLENAADEAGDDVRVEIAITREDGIEEDDVTLLGRELVLEDGELTATLTDDPIAFPPDLELAFTRELAFNDSGSYNVRVDVVNDDSAEPIVSLPFGLRSVNETPGICEE